MLLIGNGRLLKMGTGSQLIDNGCVATDGNTIVCVGETEALKAAYPDAKYLDAHGGVIMPGLINAHNHIYSAFARGMSVYGYSPRDFRDILEGLWWNLDSHMNLEDVRLSALTNYVSCIMSGVTTVIDHHASYGCISDSLFTIAEAAEEIGVRTCLCYETSDRGGHAAFNAAVKENVDFIKHCKLKDTDMLKAMYGMHASFTLSDASMVACMEHLPEDVGVHIHVAEGMTDVYDALAKYGRRVVNRLHDHGLLGPKTILGHCIHINTAEMEILRETDTMVVHNPESNMGNAVGCPPTMHMIHKGILTGLGTDGYTSDMFESMKVANCLHKHNLCDPTAAWTEVPQMLFKNNPVIGERLFGRTIGVLEPGAVADIIVVDYDPLTPMTSDNFSGHILFGMSGRDVTTTVINGVVKMKDRELIGIDKAAIMAKSREQAQALWNRINKGGI